ncbi:uncharacterized protein C8Q71DRAFT_727901 [Rhodofomes roseus]|uniref:Uncharacterized protein n=1 Tax=Rhodofomes roseus TaxID=34475 RepID=A0ABQ8JZ89_9APHY|nr:uncharacterized protein C8Q71DRAFT_727901 [Rhodofomes roseus]KAH9829626.1 hypothetical protein C8Q71DRAFT_727901 [Rhodofomes roseus]
MWNVPYRSRTSHVLQVWIKSIKNLKFNTDSVHTSKNFTTDSYKRKAGLVATHIKGLKAADTNIGAPFRCFNSNIVHAGSIWAKLPWAGQPALVEFDVEVSVGKAWEQAKEARREGKRAKGKYR